MSEAKPCSKRCVAGLDYGTEGDMDAPHLCGHCEGTGREPEPPCSKCSKDHGRLPHCAMPGCPNAADPRWYDTGGHMVCDGHAEAVHPECRCEPKPDPASAATVMDGGVLLGAEAYGRSKPQNDDDAKLARLQALCEVPRSLGADSDFATAAREGVPLLFARLADAEAMADSLRDIATKRAEAIAGRYAAEAKLAERDAEIARLKSDLHLACSNLEVEGNAAIAFEQERDAALARVAALESEVNRVRDLIDRDRTGLAAALNDVRKHLASYSWIPNGEWGSYDWAQRSEETLRKEIGWCHDAIARVAGEALEESGRRAHEAFNPPKIEARAAHDAEEGS